MSQIANELVTLFLLVLASGFFAISETALLTARKSQLQDWTSKGNRRAKLALELTLIPNRLIAALQAAMMFVAISAGVLASGTITPFLSTRLAGLPVLGAYHQQLSAMVVVITLTYLFLLIGQLVPKRLGSRHPEAIATLLALPLRWFTGIFSPVIYALDLSTEAVSFLFGRQTVGKPAVTEEEIKKLVQQSTEAGVLEESEQDMLEAVLRLGDKTARSLMTPRTQIAWLDLADSADRTRAKIVASGHSCFPVATGTLDKLDGVVQSKDLLARSLEGHGLDLKALMQQPLMVPRTVTALEVLDSFKKSGQHIALVVDEYGGIEGLLTDHDILEAIAGDIPFDGKPHDPKAMQRHDGSWLLDGMLSIDEFKEILRLDTLPGEKRDAYQTLGGFVFTRMGRIPSVADCFEWNDLHFEVVDMDGKRIDKVLVSPSKSERQCVPTVGKTDKALSGQ